VKGAVLRADAFGNLTTNFRSEDLPESALKAGTIKLQVGTHQVTRLVETFASGNKRRGYCLFGLERLSRNWSEQGKCRAHFGLGRGAAVILEK